MAREEGVSKGAQAYSDARDARLARNAEKINSLKLSAIASDFDALTKTAPAQKPRKKVIRKLLDILFLHFVLLC